MSGFAPIKAEYRRDTKQVADSDYLSLGRKPGSGESVAVDDVKIKGRNKKRPVNRFDLEKREKVCPGILDPSAKTCQFGENCAFIHDLTVFIRDFKKPDIGSACPNFDNLGFCRFGITCRFAEAHTDPLTGQNRIDVEKAKHFEEHPQDFNKLSKDTLTLLRKKKYQYPAWKRADKIVSERAKALATKADVGELKPPSPKSMKIDEESAADIGSLAFPERKRLDLTGKLYLAPLTTVGNLPFRRICKKLGADVTCSEMAMPLPILQGHASEWALMKRHASEDIFGVQLCGSYPDTMSQTVELIQKEDFKVDFIDINLGCPIELVFKKGLGAAMMGRTAKLSRMLASMRLTATPDLPITAKIRTGIDDDKRIAHTVIRDVFQSCDLLQGFENPPVDLVTLHGRSRQQRYTKLADWNYIEECSGVAKDGLSIFGNGDILSWEDYQTHKDSVSGCMIARGALIKPWIFTEIKESRHWDISSNERFDLLKSFVSAGFEHWGSDTRGVETTRKFLLEWLSFLCRYVPVGLLERLPQRINEKPLPYVGRNDLETLMASSFCGDWIKLSEMLCGPVPDGFQFVPKHKANSYQSILVDVDNK